MNYIREGQGDALVLVHGALTDGSMWRPHMEYLASRYDVIAVHQRHFEAPETGGFGLNTHGDDLASLLKTLLKDKPAKIAAWSYGADVVLNMLVKHELPLSGVFLYEPGYPGCLEGPEMDAWQADAQAMFGKVFEHFSAGNLPLAVEALIDGSGNAPGYFHSQDASVQALQLGKAHTLTRQLNQQESPAITRPAIEGLRTPLHIGFGSETRDLFRIIAQETAVLCTTSELSVFKGEAHMFPQEDPAGFAACIRDLFDA